MQNTGGLRVPRNSVIWAIDPKMFRCSFNFLGYVFLMFSSRLVQINKFQAQIQNRGWSPIQEYPIIGYFKTYPDCPMKLLGQKV